MNTTKLLKKSFTRQSDRSKALKVINNKMFLY